MKPTLQASLQPTGNLRVRGTRVRLDLRADALPFVGAGGSGGEWRSSGEGAFPGGQGPRFVREWACGGVQFEQEAVVASDGSLFGARVRATNRGAAVARLPDLVPLDCGERDAEVGSADLRKWRVLRMARQKNDIPGVYRPSAADADMEDALLCSAEMVAGMGLSYDQIGKSAEWPRAVESDPCVVVFHGEGASRVGLLLGVLGQTEHLNRVILETSGDRARLASLRVIAEFDRRAVEPGETVGTHWLLVKAGDDARGLQEDYYRLLAEEMGVPEPGPAPSVFCSWYFYGLDFRQEDLAENVGQLRRLGLPLDVFLIDHCWMDTFGTWMPNEDWSRGMDDAAKRIRDAGYAPGIWTCPFVLMARSPILQRHPGLVLRKPDGQPVEFGYKHEKTYSLDPTAPEAGPYMEEMYQRLEGWGFHHHKLDFLRAVLIHPDAAFHDPRATRARAYRRGMELVRRGVGPSSYVLACGGLFEGSAGLADGMRVGSDVSAMWSRVPRVIGHLTKIKQCVFRNVTSRLWHADPDALQVRRRKGPFRGNLTYKHLAVGLMTDEETFSCVAQQYLTGGIVCVAERMKGLARDRRALLRHLLPGAPTAAARPLDPEHAACPTRYLTAVRSPYPGIPGWHTVAVANWEDRPARVSVEVPALGAGRFAAFDFARQKFVGLVKPGARLALKVPAHGVRLLRFAPWNGRDAVLLGTDAHLSGGAAEFESLEADSCGIQGRIRGAWHGRLRVHAGLPTKGGGCRAVSREYRCRRAVDFRVGPLAR
jgi:hypothetical protein